MSLQKAFRHIPNALTVSRLIGAPMLGYLVCKSNYAIGFPLFVWCGFTDLADGYLARKFKWQSKFGSILDPLADKLLVGTLTISFYATGAITPLTAYLVLGRDATLLAGALWYAKIKRFPLSQVQITPFTSSKINTALQLALLGLCMWEGYRKRSEIYANTKMNLERAVQFTTVFSGISYLIWHKHAFKLNLPK